MGELAVKLIIWWVIKMKNFVGILKKNYVELTSYYNLFIFSVFISSNGKIIKWGKQETHI